MGLNRSRLSCRALVTSSVVFSHSLTTARYRSSSVMKPILYWSSMSTTRCSVSWMSSYFFLGTVISAMEMVMAPRVEYL